MIKFHYMHIGGKFHPLTISRFLYSILQNKMESIKKVIIFGGTHGNEMSGIFLVNKWKRNDKELKDRLPSCPVQLHISNPEATALCRRYKDCDLNRQFTEEILNSTHDGSETVPFEVKRAREINEMVKSSPKSEKPEVILDLHNTTSNMGCTLIVRDLQDPVTLHMAAYIQQKMEEDKNCCRIYNLQSRYSSIRALGKHGIGIEVGPQPQSVLRSDICQIQQSAVLYALDFVKKYNEGFEFPSRQIKTYQMSQRVGFPKGFSPATAVIHEHIQDNDFQAISMQDPIFRTIDDQVLCLDDLLNADERPDDVVYPVFINEAAYYEKNAACWLATAGTTVLQPLSLTAVN